MGQTRNVNPNENRVPRALQPDRTGHTYGTKANPTAIAGEVTTLLHYSTCEYRHRVLATRSRVQLPVVQESQSDGCRGSSAGAFL